MKKILFAYHISDITVARYCAAMNFDYLIINLDVRDYEKNIDLIKQIQEWVEGPEIILCSDDENKLQVFHSMNGLKTLFIDQILNCEFEFIRDNSLIEFIEYKSNSISQNVKKIQFINDALNIDEFINTDAYIIMMGKEEKVGIYDFDRLDEVFEKIEYWQ